MNLYPHLDFLCDRVSKLTYTTMDGIGTRAKELDKILDEIVRNLGRMNEVNYNKNKLDYLFELLEKSIEQNDQIDIVLDRIKAIERIHKESPNIEASIN